MAWHLHVAVHSRQDTTCIRHSAFALICVLCLVQARKIRSAHASGPEGRDLRTDTKTLSSSLHSMVSYRLYVLQMTSLSNCCLTVGLFDVKRECIICRGQNFWHKLWTLRLMADHAMLTVCHFCRLYFTKFNEEFCFSERSSFLSDFSIPWYC